MNIPMENKDKIILHLCASKFGSDSKPYRDAGYDVRLVTKDVDVRKYKPPENVYGIIANPPCTMFSHARTIAKIPRNLDQGLELVVACLNIIWECQKRITNDQQRIAPLKFWVMENPDGMLKWFLGKPAFIYQPYEFHADYSKKTNLWGIFNEPKKPFFNRQLPPRSSIGDKHWEQIKDREERTDLKSVAPPEFTKAFFESNQ